MKKLISVIIVTYNCEDFIDNCIKSVLKFLPEKGEIIIIDNNSTDETAEKIRKYDSNPNVKILESGENLGFGKANNKASKLAEGEYLFLLNPDTELIEPVFNKLIDLYKSWPDIGLVSPKLVSDEGKVQAVAQNLPTVLGAIKEYIFGKSAAYEQYVPTGDSFVKVEAVYAAAVLIKKDLFLELGGFDDKFFMYYEDVDLCRRLKKIGKSIYYFPGVKVKHLIGASKTTLNRHNLNLESSKKYHGLVKFLLLQLIFLIPRLRRKLKLS